MIFADIRIFSRYVAQYKSAEDLGKGLLYVLNHPDGTLGQNARNKVMSHYSESAVAKRYRAVYETN